MTEKEKAESGLLYNAEHDAQLISDRLKCKELCFDYNALRPAETGKKAEIIKKLFKKTGKKFLVEPSLWCDYGYNISIGENFYANHNLVILDTAAVSFGDNVLIGPNCGFFAPAHPFDVEQRNQGLEFSLPIAVGDNVWIGGGAVVLQGVKIGSNSIIGAGSVVNKDIEPNVIAAGNPCRKIRAITEADRLKFKSEDVRQ